MLARIRAALSGGRHAEGGAATGAATSKHYAHVQRSLQEAAAYHAGLRRLVDSDAHLATALDAWHASVQDLVTCSSALQPPREYTTMGESEELVGVELPQLEGLQTLMNSLSIGAPTAPPAVGAPSKGVPGEAGAALVGGTLGSALRAALVEPVAVYGKVLEAAQARLKWLLRHGAGSESPAARTAAPGAGPVTAPALTTAQLPADSEAAQQEVALAAAVQWLVQAAQGLRGLHAAALQEALRVAAVYAAPRDVMPQLSTALLAPPPASAHRFGRRTAPPKPTSTPKDTSPPPGTTTPAEAAAAGAPTNTTAAAPTPTQLSVVPGAAAPVAVGADDLAAATQPAQQRVPGTGTDASAAQQAAATEEAPILP